MVLLRGFIQTVKEEFTPILHNLSHRIEEEGILSNSFYDMSIILVPKPGKESSKKKKKSIRKLYAKSLMNLYAKIFNKILANQIQHCIKRIIDHDQLVFNQGVQG